MDKITMACVKNHRFATYWNYVTIITSKHFMGERYWAWCPSCRQSVPVNRVND